MNLNQDVSHVRLTICIYQVYLTSKFDLLYDIKVCYFGCPFTHTKRGFSQLTSGNECVCSFHMPQVHIYSEIDLHTVGSRLTVIVYTEITVNPSKNRPPAALFVIIYL